jgi:hypothetical protein
MNRAEGDAGFTRSLVVIPIVVVVLVIGAAGVFALKIRNATDTKGARNWTNECSGTQRVAMTHTPMDLADIRNIEPMGLTAGAHVTPIDHLYVYPKAIERDAVPVYAMADGFVVSIEERNVKVDTGEGQATEYRIVMQHSCQTVSYFDLVTSVDAGLLKKSKSFTALTGLHVPIKSGQVIGRIGGQSLDTAIYNFDLRLPGFINEQTYAGEPWKIHSDDFFAYFAEPLRGDLLALNSRKIEPYSGKIDYDQPGKLIGNWFLEGTNGYAGLDEGDGPAKGIGYWSGHLSVHYGPIDGTSIVVSLGQFGSNGQPTAFAVVGNTPDPATISAESGIVKYELIGRPNGGANTPVAPPEPDTGGPKRVEQVQGVGLFQVLPGEKLKVEVFPGKSAGDVTDFTPGARTYER